MRGSQRLSRGQDFWKPLNKETPTGHSSVRNSICCVKALNYGELLAILNYYQTFLIQNLIFFFFSFFFFASDSTNSKIFKGWGRMIPSICLQSLTLYGLRLCLSPIYAACPYWGNEGHKSIKTLLEKPRI